MTKIEARNFKQCRCIRKYARAYQLKLEVAAMRWCIDGCAERWAEQN